MIINGRRRRIEEVDMKEAGMDRSLFINMYIYLQAVEDQESACERSRNRHCCLVNTVNVLALVADN